MGREEIDPQLPYIQVHRSAGVKAAGIASALGVTYQHARGGMEVFWESLADRRILAKALEAGEIVLEADELRRRLKMALGVDADLELFVSAGFLEPRHNGFRVRGMSAYINTERARLAKKATPAAPGKHSGATPAPPEPDPGRTPVPPRSDPGATPVPPGRGERREVRGESLTDNNRELAPTVSLPVVPTPALPEDRGASGPAYFAWVQNERVAAGFGVEKPPPLAALGRWFSEAMGELNGDVERLDATLAAFVHSAYWRERNCPFRGFMSEWRSFVPRKAARP